MGFLLASHRCSTFQLAGSLLSTNARYMCPAATPEAAGMSRLCLRYLHHVHYLECIAALVLSCIIFNAQWEPRFCLKCRSARQRICAGGHLLAGAHYSDDVPHHWSGNAGCRCQRPTPQRLPGLLLPRYSCVCQISKPPSVHVCHYKTLSAAEAARLYWDTEGRGNVGREGHRWEHERGCLEVGLGGVLVQHQMVHIM